MTRYLTCLLATLPVLLPAQIQWEHTYAGSQLNRVVLDASGETYFLAKNCQLELYRPDHTLWQYRKLAAPWGATFCANFLLSEQYVDNDPEIEVIYDWSTDDISCPVTGCTLEDDNGTKIWLNKDSPAPQYSIGPGLSPKLLAGSCVYALPEAALEKDYGPDHWVKRLQMPQGGRYVVYDKYKKLFEGYQLYNDQHQLLKTINLPLEHFQSLDDVSHDYFNSDTLLEFAGVRWIGGDTVNDRRFTVIQENGQFLLDYPCRGALKNRQAGLPDEYWIWRTLPSGESVTEIMDSRSFAIRHGFPSAQTGARFSPDGSTVFYWTRHSYADSVVLLYDGNFQAAGAFLFPETYRHFWNLQVTKGRFSGSGAFEFLFSNSRNGTTYVTCLDEKGQVVLDFPGAQTARIDQQPGLEDRFFLVYKDSTAVYRFTGGSTNTGEAEGPLAVLVYPNPCQSDLFVQMPEGIREIRLLDLNGRQVRHWQTSGAAEQLHLSTASLPAGLYFLQWKMAKAWGVIKVAKGQ